MARLKTLFFSCVIFLFTLCQVHGKISFQQLPEKTRTKIRNGLESIFPNNLNSLVFEKLKGGHSGDQIYKISLDKKRVVLRVNSGRKMFKISEIAGKNAIGPKVLFPNSIEQKQDILITEFLPGKSIDRQWLRNNLGKAIKKIKQMHQIKEKSLPLVPSIFKRIDRLYKNLNTANKRHFLKAMRVKKNVANLIQFNPSQFVLTHNDLYNTNFIVNKENVWVIDWADAGKGDPLTDLASFTNGTFMTSEIALQSLSLYLQPNIPTTQDFIHFKVMNKMCLLRQAIDLAKRLQSSGYDVQTLKDTPTYENVIKQYLQGDFSIENNTNINILINATLNKFLDEQGW